MTEPAPARIRMARTLGTIVTLVGAGYLAWRVLATSAGVHPALFWPLLAVEGLAWAALALATARLRPRAETPRLQPLDLEVEAVIVVDDEPLDLVEPSAIAVLALRGRVRPHLYDASGREEVRQLAERLGIPCTTARDHGADPSTVDDVLPDLSGRLVLVVPAGCVPAPDALLVSTGGFALERLAAVELALAVEQVDPLDSLPDDVARPREGALLLRLSALRAIGGPVLLSRAARADAVASLRASGHAVTSIDAPVVASAHPEARHAVDDGRADEGSTDEDAAGVPLERAVARAARALAPLVLVGLAVLAGLGGLEPFAATGPVPLAIAAGWVTAQSLAAHLVRRAGGTDLDSATTTLLALEHRLRSLRTRRRRTAYDPDASTRSDLVRLVRTPVAVGAVLGVVLLARAVDAGARGWLGIALLPALEPAALVALVGASLVGIGVVVRLLLRVRARQRLHRQLRRFPTELPARVRGITVACVDLHQRGAALILPRELVDEVGTLTFAVACRALTGASAPAHGTMTITSRRPVDAEGTMLRIGGPVVWNDDESRRRVIAHCYVVEPYAARQRTWVRDAARVPVSLEATLDGSPATCVDVSATGAALVTRDGHWVLDDRVPLRVLLPTGEHAEGDFLVRNITATPGGLVRLGGTVAWHGTDWLERYGALPAGPSAGRARGRADHGRRAGPLVSGR